MNTLWTAASLISGLLLLVILLKSKRKILSSGIHPPADSLPEQPIPMEHEHAQQEDMNCET